MRIRLIMVLFTLLLIIFESVTYAAPQTGNQVEELQTKVDQLTQRLKSLEPDKPKTMYRSEFDHLFPSKLYPVKEIIKIGMEIPFETGLNNPEWKRPVYSQNWHSTYWGGRWSYMPYNLNNSQHRMFVGYQSAGIWFDLSESLGLNEEVKNVSFAEEKVNEKTILVIMQANVKKIINKGNQFVLISEPMRDGLQVLAIKTGSLLKLKEPLLFHLVTPDGYEFDYNS